MLYNPDLRTAVIMIPGLCGIILVFVGTVATALGVVRERQSGTMEQLAVMPFRPRDVFVGKIAPYLLIAAADMVIVVVAGMLLFDVPFRGSVATFALGALLFLFVTLGTGVLISSVSQTQGQAIQLAMMTMLPQFLLSGLFFPLYSMPLGRALDRLPAPPHLVHQGRARSHGARRTHRGALAPVDDPRGDGRRRVHRLHPAVPPRPGPGRTPGRRAGGRERAQRALAGESATGATGATG